MLWLAASIEGQLTNALTGAPVRKADVAVGTVEGTVVKRVLSDVNGHYAVSGLADGRYRVAAARAGYLPALAGAVVALKGDERRQVNIALETPAVITGHVVDEEQDPVEGVEVAAIVKDAGSGAVRFVAKAKTNDKGEYRFAGLTAGEYVIRTGRAAAPLGEVYQPAFYAAAVEWESASPVRVAAGAEPLNEQTIHWTASLGLAFSSSARTSISRAPSCLRRASISSARFLARPFFSIASSRSAISCADEACR